MEAQNTKKDTVLWATSLSKVVSTHPMGIFISRSFGDFGAKKKGAALHFEYGMGNIWLPKTTAYYPTNDADKAEAEKYPWHFRGHKNLQNPDSISFQADGVLRTYRFTYDFPIATHQHLAVTAKMYSLDGGEFPFSAISSDRFIEWFHSNVAGGEDPFARKQYPLNQALIEYTDANGKEMTIKQGDIGLSGIELNYQYQLPSEWLVKNGFAIQGNVMFGINTSSFNRSIDNGVGILGTKDFAIANRTVIRLGGSGEIVRLNSFNSKTAVDLFDVSRISQLASFAGWERTLKNNNKLSISYLFRMQSSYHNEDKKETYALAGSRAVSHWHYAISHLYQKTYGNSLIVAYLRKQLNYSVYIRQDLRKVDNSPDIQTGMSISYRI